MKLKPNPKEFWVPSKNYSIKNMEISLQIYERNQKRHQGNIPKSMIASSFEKTIHTTREGKKVCSKA